MRKFIVLLLFSMVTACAFGQTDYQDVVYLKNGSIIRGMIVEQVPNVSLKIETSDGSVFVYELAQVEKITKEPRKVPQGTRANAAREGAHYRGIVDVGGQIGAGTHGMDRLSLNIINGVQINPYFSIGLGTGLRLYTGESAAVIPLFADFRTTFIRDKTTPYLAVGIGYSFDASNSLRSLGFLLNPSAGIQFGLSDKIAMHVGLSYEMQRMDFVRVDHLYNGYYGTYPSFTAYTANSGALGLVVGISF
ncbi:MAG: hypothetical protein JSS84_02985 [Bacteroidetes bacterium]|nr:hypothetical protein [Bacteroidota bacterium]